MTRVSLPLGRRVSLPLRVATPLLCALLLAGGGPAAADIVMPGQKILTVENKLDLGEFADYATRTWTVRKRDTLGHISELLLGTSRRVAEIEALNPGIKPEALQIGQVLLIPPRRGGGAARQADLPDEDGDGEATPSKVRPWMDFYAVTMPGWQTLTRIGAGGTLPWSPYETMVVGVLHEHAAAFETAFAAAEGDFAKRSAVLNGRHVFKSPGFAGRYSTTESDARSRIRREWTLVDAKDGKLVVQKAHEQGYGAGGQPVEGGSAGFFGSTGLLLLLLAATALFGILLVARMRGEPTGALGSGA